jgi:heme-degrading monooxygenase HmoA
VDTRLVFFRGANDIGSGVGYLADSVVPALCDQPGCQGVSVSTNDAERVVSVYSLWSSEADREAAAAALDDAWEKARGIIGGLMTVELYEQTSEAISKQPSPGCVINEVRARLDPGYIDGALSFFTAELLPQIAAIPGFCALRNMVDRETGRGVSHAIWEHRRAMEEALFGLPSRLRAAQGRGISIGEVMQREIRIAEVH